MTTFQPGDLVEVIDAGGSSDPRLALGTLHTVASVEYSSGSMYDQYVKFTNSTLPRLYAERLRLVNRPTQTKENNSMLVDLNHEIQRAAPVVPPVTGVRITLTPLQLRYITKLVGRSGRTMDHAILGEDYPVNGMSDLYAALAQAARDAGEKV